ncbi:octanoyl-[acyl-carrier-protein]:protein N-octanoyltransferase LIPT2, mitochondrial [Lonchura striata]|uniref:octanoyl-[acyl-carrier-protein]:protein N-octanoyltransferase LIPT2, mitochondrial n=1 Tax=Lonchura striata TaxID=40157 RepID=UPI000B4D0FC1|nr:putative lipoyltransferase 2, mitochondrial [Lonchura striata domestica]
MSRRAVRVLRLGAVPYAEALRVQERCVAAARAARGPAAGRGGAEALPAESVVLSEPAQPVYTWGLRGAPGAAAAAALRARGAALVAARRGGHITFHGPGQLLAFPVLDLRRRRLPLRAYVAGLEALVLRLCRRLGLGAVRALPPPFTGVWMGDSKLCAIGVHCGNHITSHGLALNCCTDLSWFEHIVPCGLEGKGVTSLSHELGQHVAVGNVIEPFLDSFQEVFDCTLVSSEDPGD